MADTPKASERQARTPLPRDDDGEKRPYFRTPRMRILLIVGGLLAANYIFVALFAPGRVEPVTIPYNPVFLEQIRDGNVERISTTGETVDGRFKKDFTYQNHEPTKVFETEIPTFADEEELSDLLEQEGVVIEAEPVNQSRGFLVSLLLGFGPVILLIALFVFLFRRSAGGGAMGALGSFGRSKARRVEGGEQKITFADVAGIDEAKAELAEVVDFLKTPERYQKLGGRIPKGVLLSGAPGTGKTLLARAVAGEAGVPFFSVSASEFVEAIVGIGASRVRDLFKQAKESQPAIIFIDELDAIGRSRSSGQAGFGGNDEREQTLNQILTEMDGFESGAAVIVVAATNRPEVLGADIANLSNEAALLAARRGHEKVTHADFTDSLEKIVLGAPRGLVLSDEEKRRTAYHEAGHALVGMLTPGADPVRKVSIIPRSMSLGVTISAPDVERTNYDEEHLITRIKVALGGRVAEELVYDSISAGAESDIQQLTAIARQMVGRWGVSRAIGPIAVLPSDGQNPLLPGAAQTSESTQRLVDEEVPRIVEEAHAEVTRLLG